MAESFDKKTLFSASDPSSPKGFAEARQAKMAAAEPLAVRMRPRTLEEFAGQKHFVGEGKLLRRMLEADRLSRLVFYGPPGTGKTSLARVIENHTKATFN